MLTYESEPPTEPPAGTRPAYQVPRITIDDPDQNRVKYESSSSAEAEMSSSHRQSRTVKYASSSSTEIEAPTAHRSSHHHSSSSSSKGKSHSSKSKSKKDDWSEITDPEERRRIQNRIAQRKFRDKAKEARESEERDAENRAHAGHSYHVPTPEEMGTDDELSGLPWGSLSLKHVVSKGKAKEDASRRGSHRGDERSHYGERSSYESYDAQGPAYQTYYEGDSAYYDDGDRAYYDYGSGSGSGHGGSSR